MAAELESDSDFEENEIPDDENSRKGYALLTAAGCNDVGQIAGMLDANPDSVNFSDLDGYTALHRASYNNHLESIKLLLTRGAKIDARTNDGWQPLHSAVRWNMLEASDLLLKCGADVNARTMGNLTPLHLAASLKDSRRILLMLLNHPSVDATIVSGAGETAHDIAYRTSANVSLFQLVEPALNKFK